MKALALIILFIIVPLAALEAQDANPDVRSYMGAVPKFFEELLDFSSGQKDLTRVDIFVQVPHTTIQFVKKDSLFIANYSITLSVYDERKEKLVSEKTWDEKISLKDFAQTISKENAGLALRSFYMQPGNYVLRTSVIDNESNKEYPNERPFVVRDLSAEVSLSDIMILAKKIEVGGKNKITPYVSLNVANFKNGLPVFYEIYSVAPQRLSIEYIIRDDKHAIVFQDTVSRNVDSGKTQIFYTLKDSSFSLGYYDLFIQIKNSENSVRASSSKKFFSRWIGIPATVNDLDKAIDEMIYIASTYEINQIKDAPTKEEKMKRFMEYWKKQNPTTSSEDNPVFDEYYGRVAYANAHFKYYIEGWRSDKGMVFIILGPPDNIERHPFDMDAKPYEIWSYYQLNVSLVFIDQTGFGEYRLVTPLTGNLTKFRP